MRATITILPGDGIGPEVTEAAVTVLEAAAAAEGHHFEFIEGAIGGAAIDACGSPLPEETLEACEVADAVLLGAVGGPRWAHGEGEARPEQGLLDLRKRFSLFANLRPIPVFPSLIDQAPLRCDLLGGVDILFVRELTGGLYFGRRQEQGEGSSAFDTLEYSEDEVERIAHVAFRAARRRRRRVTSVDKANVLASMRLWRRTVERVATGYPDVECNHLLVDACAMHLLQSPKSFDVVLAGNLFGDILSDEASVLGGSLGLLPSASLGNDSFGLYEPVHGSAPDIAGHGRANPLGAILSAALLLRYSLGREDLALMVETAVANALDQGARTADLARGAKEALSTRAMTEAVLEHLGSGVWMTV